MKKKYNIGTTKKPPMKTPLDEVRPRQGPRREPAKHTRTWEAYLKSLPPTALILLVLLVLNDSQATAVTYAIAPAIVAAGIAAASSGAQIYANGKMNKKTREWNEKMYGVTRTDALKDWQMQNEYNSPQQQMARLQEAGLNPNLVYDNGNAIQPSPPVKSSDVKSWSPNELPIADSVNNVAGVYFDAAIKDEQVKNMAQSRENAIVDNANKIVDGLIKSEILQEKGFKNANAQKLFDTTMATMLAQQDKIAREGNYITSQENLTTQKIYQNNKINPMLVKDIELGLRLRSAQINATEAQTQAAKQSVLSAISSMNLTNKELELLNQGLNKTSSPMWKILMDALSGDSENSIINKIDKTLRNQFKKR